MATRKQRNSEQIGTPLDKVIRERCPGGVELSEVVAWADQLADAIDGLHAERRAHGSIDPRHVVIDTAGHARLIEADAHLTATAEERQRDLARLALVCYVALDGVGALDRFDEPGSSSVPPLHWVSNQVNAALRSAVGDVAERPTRAREFVQMLQGAPLRGGAAGPRPTTRRNGSPLLVGGAMVVVAGIVAVWLVVRLAGDPAPEDAPTDQRVLARPEATTGGTNAAPVVTDVTAIERRWRAARDAVLKLRNASNPAVAALLDDAERHSRRADNAASQGRLVETAEAYESALAGLAAAAGADADVTVVGELVAVVQSQIDDTPRTESPFVQQEIDEILELVTAGRSAFDAGSLATADEHLRAARMRLNALPVLEGNAAVAAEAQARWASAAATVPEVVADSIRAQVDEADALAGDALAYDDAGRFADASAAWDEATQTLAALLEQHDAQRAAADGGHQAWQEAHLRSPADWMDEPAVQEATSLAQTIAALADDAMDAGRFTEAHDTWARAAAALDEATRRQNERLTERAADLERAAADRRFDAAFSALDEIAPFVDADWTARRRIDLHLDVARRATRTDRDAAMRSLDAVLAGQPDHAEALALRDEVAKLFTPQTGDEQVNSLDLVFVYIPPGEFTMGRADGSLRDGTAHSVRLTRGFWMSSTEVTRAQFATFARITDHRTDAEIAGAAFGLDDGGRWRRIDGLTWRDPGFEQTDIHPVVCVSHRDAIAFCRWLSELEGRTYRLPTEAEWEYAARAGTTTAFSWGDEASTGHGRGSAADASWRERFGATDVFPWSDGYVYTSPVGAFGANPWGLRDVHGNVQEWCADRYGPYPTGLAENPTDSAGAEGAPRVIRGGSFAASPAHCRTDHRDASAPDSCFVTYGFRVVLEEEPR